MEERGRLWFIVIATRYGEGGRIKDGGRFGYVWWRNLSSIHEGAGLGVENWFLDNLGRSIGDVSSTLFWWDPWLEGEF